MDLREAKKFPLNKYTHSVRASQAVLQYGVGAMVDFPDQTLMTAAPEYWREQVTQIHDERLEKVLHVDYFGLPMGQDDPQCRDGISYVRFPEWYFCPKCRKFQSIKTWTDEYRKRAKTNQLDRDPDMVKYVQCPICRQNLVVTRIVTACECGHIDDFPWVKWVHCCNNYGPKPVCDAPSLTFKTSASSTEGLEGLSISCVNCNAHATLRGAFDIGKLEELDKKHEMRYDFRCTGRHPWKNTKEKCVKYPKVLQRGSSSVYFPITLSSLVIPPYSGIITKKVEESAAFARQKDSFSMLRRAMSQEAVTQVIQVSLDQNAKEIALETGLNPDQVRQVLERKWLSTTQNDEEEYSAISLRYRAEEYEALSGRVVLDSDDRGDFLREQTDISEYGIPYLKSISLIHKIREVQALTGFSRLKPYERTEGDEDDRTVSIKQKETNWYPAYEIRGEGIFIEFDETAINRWIEKNKEVLGRAEAVNDNYRKSFIGSNKPRTITPKFLLLHTLSHLLIKQLSFECGYSIASLKERIYCGESDGMNMSGILIYTASGDSEGTMGGLVRQGHSDTFPGLFRKAIESAMTCSNDPVCSLSMGQGRDSLNLSACYSCTLIPETSCEEFNIFLDRGVVIGICENREIGFYSSQVYGEKMWSTEEPAKITPSVEMITPDTKKPFLLTEKGTDLTEAAYSDIWKGLAEWAEDDGEISLLKALIDNPGFNSKEKPQQDCIFRVPGHFSDYKCDLFWEKSKVGFFTIDNEDCYNAARETDIVCFFSGNKEITPELILSSLKER